MKKITLIFLCFVWLTGCDAIIGDRYIGFYQSKKDPFDIVKITVTDKTYTLEHNLAKGNSRSIILFDHGDSSFSVGMKDSPYRVTFSESKESFVWMGQQYLKISAKKADQIKTNYQTKLESDKEKRLAKKEKEKAERQKRMALAKKHAAACDALGDEYDVKKAVIRETYMDTRESLSLAERRLHRNAAMRDLNVWWEAESAKIPDCR